MQNTIVVLQELTYKEFLSAILQVFARSRRLRAYLLIFIGMITSSQLLGYLTAPHYSFGLIDLFKMLLIPALMVMGLVIVLTVISYILYRSKPHMFRDVSYEFTHWGVTRYGEEANFSKPWREIKRFKETKQFFLFYIGPVDVHIIQKKLIGDETWINAFRTMLQEQVRK